MPPVKISGYTILNNVTIGPNNSVPPVIPPVAPTVNSINTTDTTPTITGTAIMHVGDVLSVEVDSEIFDNVSVVSGNWSVTVTNPLAAGSQYGIAATVTNTAGATATGTGTVTIEVVTGSLSVYDIVAEDFFTPDYYISGTSRALLGTEYLHVVISELDGGGSWEWDTAGNTQTGITFIGNYWQVDSPPGGEGYVGPFPITATIRLLADDSIVETATGQLTLDANFTVPSIDITANDQTTSNQFPVITGTATLPTGSTMWVEIGVQPDSTIYYNVLPIGNDWSIDTATAVGSAPFTGLTADTSVAVSAKDMYGNNPDTIAIITFVSVSLPAVPTVTFQVTSEIFPVVTGTAVIDPGVDLIGFTMAGSTYGGTPGTQNQFIFAGDAWSFDTSEWSATSGPDDGLLTVGNYPITVTVENAAGSAASTTTIVKSNLNLGNELTLTSQRVVVGRSIVLSGLTRPLQAGETMQAEIVSIDDGSVYTFGVTPNANGTWAVATNFSLPYPQTSEAFIRIISAGGGVAAQAQGTLLARYRPQADAYNVNDATAPFTPYFTPGGTVFPPLQLNETLKVELSGTGISTPITWSTADVAHPVVLSADRTQWSIDLNAYPSGTYTFIEGDSYNVYPVISVGLVETDAGSSGSLYYVPAMSPSFPVIAVNDFSTTSPNPEVTGTISQPSGDIINAGGNESYASVTVTVGGATYEVIPDYGNGIWAVTPGTVAPLSGTYTPLTSGPHTVTATVVDRFGMMGDDTGTITVVASIPPVVYSSVATMNSEIFEYDSTTTLPSVLPLSGTVTIDTNTEELWVYSVYNSATQQVIVIDDVAGTWNHDFPVDPQWFAQPEYPIPFTVFTRAIGAPTDGTADVPQSSGIVVMWDTDNAPAPATWTSSGGFRDMLLQNPVLSGDVVGDTTNLSISAARGGGNGSVEYSAPAVYGHMWSVDTRTAVPDGETIIFNPMFLPAVDDVNNVYEASEVSVLADASIIGGYTMTRSLYYVSDLPFAPVVRNISISEGRPLAISGTVNRGQYTLNNNLKVTVTSNTGLKTFDSVPTQVYGAEEFWQIVLDPVDFPEGTYTVTATLSNSQVQGGTPYNTITSTGTLTITAAVSP